MKKITLLLIAMISYVGYSQSTIDFETGGVGAAWTWTVDQNGTNPALEFVANPNTTGNTSAMTAKLTAQAAGQAWALTYSDGIGSFTFDANNSLVKMWVRKDVATDVAIKFEIPGGINKEVKASTTVTNGDWEELSFDFSSVIGSSYSRIVIIPDFLVRTSNHIVYFDQITFNPGTPAATPTTNAPIPPTRVATDVISIYSDSYTNINVTNFNPGWGQSGSVDTTFDPTGNGTNTVLTYTNFNYQGTEFSVQDASGMENLHVDVWTDTTGAVLKVSPINDNANGGTGVGELLVNVPIVNAGWSSVDITKSSFTGMVWDKLYQLKFSSQSGTNPSNVYIDNIYFWKAATADLDEASLNSIKMHPNPASGIVKFSTTLGDALSVSVFDLLGKQVIPVQTIKSELNISALNPGMYFVNMVQGASSVTKKLLVN